LREKCKISDLWLPSLDNHFHLCSCLGRQSHERHTVNLTYTEEILYRQKNQDLESQVLNRAIIVNAWGHGVAKKCNTITKLGMPSLEHKVLDFRNVAAKS
jgi:hypothetical protein